ncbi:MAG: 1-acyl-sn-glycerol-3-phosphate acyltransferase [Chloroflexi bacterium]|nr:1-acyl-sn-glycerol-3-phosphate acyltransferase [Chloroflexota bacterium]
MPFLYPICTTMMKEALLLLSQWHVKGQDNVPSQGPLIIAANHLSFIDPPLLAASIPRRIAFMTKEEAFAPPGGFFIRNYGAFPVRRGRWDRNALRQANQLLKEGGALGMFPEGTRSWGRGLQRGYSGVAIIASRSGAPILPVGIAGSERVKGLADVFSRPAITVRLGRPFFLPQTNGQRNNYQLSFATDLIMKHIASLLPSYLQGIYQEQDSGTKKELELVEVG